MCEKCDTHVKVRANGGKNLVYHQAGKGCRENLRKTKEHKTQEKTSANALKFFGDDIHLPHDGADPIAADDHAVSEVWPEQQFDYSPCIQIEEEPCRPECISSPIQPPQAADDVSKAYPITDMADNEPEGNATGRLPQQQT